MAFGIKKGDAQIVGSKRNAVRVAAGIVYIVNRVEGCKGKRDDQ